MKWIVYYHNVNADRIEEYNIFDHGRFLGEVRTLWKKCDTRDMFAEELRKSLFYYFGSKCEWEVLVSPWCGGRNTMPRKVDVFSQVRNNWDVFVDYVWSKKGMSK